MGLVLISVEGKKKDGAVNLLSKETKIIPQNEDGEKLKKKRIGLAHLKDIVWFNCSELGLPEEATYKQVFQKAKRKLGSSPLNTGKDLELFKNCEGQVPDFLYGSYIIFFEKDYVVEATLCDFQKITCFYKRRPISSKICTKFLKIGFVE